MGVAQILPEHEEKKNESDMGNERPGMPPHMPMRMPNFGMRMQVNE